MPRALQAYALRVARRALRRAGLGACAAASLACGNASPSGLLGVASDIRKALQAQGLVGVDVTCQSAPEGCRVAWQGQTWPVVLGSEAQAWTWALPFDVIPHPTVRAWLAGQAEVLGLEVGACEPAAMLVGRGDVPPVPWRCGAVTVVARVDATGEVALEVAGTADEAAARWGPSGVWLRASHELTLWARSRSLDRAAVSASTDDDDSGAPTIEP